MTRLLALLVVAGLAAAQEPAKPAEPKPAEKKAEPKKDENPAEDEVDVQKTAERIAENAEKAGGRLKDKDAGADTRKLQDEILKDIDALIKKAQNPPPPPMGGDMNPMPPPPKSDNMPPPKGGMPPPQTPMPMGGMAGGDPMPKAGNSGGGASGTDRKDGGRRPRRDRRPRGESPMPMGMGEPMAKAGPMGKDPMPAKLEPKDGPRGQKEGMPKEDKFGKASPRRENDKLADLYKDVWGHLPERMRQEMDLYYREQFMPRYSELLRQYYAALAEQKKKGGDDR
jgi:hypothetical protein